jgi:hypothetical protein
MNARPDWRWVLVDLREAERELAVLLGDIGSRHDKELEFHTDCVRLARLSAEHVTRIAAIGRDHGERLDPAAAEPNPLSGLRDWAAGLLGGPKQVEMLRLGDLRRVYLIASAISLDWQLLGEIGGVAGAGDLTTAAVECQQETARQISWAAEQVMVRGPQILAGQPHHQDT